MMEENSMLHKVEGRSIVVDGEKREVNGAEILTLMDKFLPNLSENETMLFFSNINFLIADGEYDSSLLDGKSVEEYYFAACMEYIRYNGFWKFIKEQDTCNIFNYCGATLEELFPDEEELDMVE